MKIEKMISVWSVSFGVIAVMVGYLYLQGRNLICTCGRVLLWTSDTWSSDNSQHIADPYSFSHIQHGLIFGMAIKYFWPKLAWKWVVAGAVALEALWEMVENSSFLIERYRANTASLGYFGDSIINSVADVGFCALGVLIFQKLGFKKTIFLYILIELVMLAWIRDSLILNVIQLILPIPAVAEWQMG